MKMSKLKSRVVWLTTLAMIVTPLLAACGGTSTATPVPAATSTTAAAAPTGTTAAAGATNTPAAAAATTPTVPPTVLATGEGCASGATALTWYVGLGAGADAD